MRHCERAALVRFKSDLLRQHHAVYSSAISRGSPLKDLAAELEQQIRALEEKSSGAPQEK